MYLEQDVAQRTSAIHGCLEKVREQLASYEDVSKRFHRSESVADKASVTVAHNALVMDATRLLQTIRGPLDTLYEYIEKGAQTAAIRSLLAMGAFEKIPVDGSITATKLAEALRVDEKLLIRLMRVATIVGPFKQVSEEEYAHTPFSQIFLVPEARSFFTLVTDDFLLPWIKLHDFLPASGWKNPSQERDNPYTYAHQTGGKTVWEHLAQYPERVKALNLGMGAQTESSMWSVDIVDFRALLSPYQTSDDSILVVDIGGGKGHCLQRIHHLLADVPGRLVLQDRPEVLADTYDLKNSRIEKCAYNFFEKQPVKGAHIYYIRRVLHDWPDHICIDILRNTATAMEPGKSRIVIAENIVPPVGADMETAWMDLVVMTVSSAERTEKDWQQLLDAAGLRLEKTYTAPGTNYGAVQAVLK
ncbi:hypothetical protein VTN77DRAFT_4780 [Rasamsonia byssochlamydoides]|uniref:uncharacterized protein n=1 Tax=Rasamsonia byssochlamydoides TaxID=89139 RepID=UPI0037449550